MVFFKVLTKGVDVENFVIDKVCWRALTKVLLFLLRLVDPIQVLKNFIYEFDFLALQNENSFLNSITDALIPLTLDLFDDHRLNF